MAYCLEDLLAVSLLPLDEATNDSVEGQGEKEKTNAQWSLLQQELGSEHFVRWYFHSILWES